MSRAPSAKAVGCMCLCISVQHLSRLSLVPNASMKPTRLILSSVYINGAENKEEKEDIDLGGYLIRFYIVFFPAIVNNPD